MEQYIQIYMLYLQDNQINWFVFAKFTANNFILKTIKVSLFLANYGQHLQIGFKSFSDIPCPAYYTLQVVEANEFVKKIKKLHQFLINKMIWAQSVYKAIVNKK